MIELFLRHHACGIFVVCGLKCHFHRRWEPTVSVANCKSYLTTANFGSLNEWRAGWTG